MKDSAIKLFGKTITLLPDKAAVSDVSLSENRESSFATSTSHDSKDEHESMDPTEETLTEVATSSDIDDETNTPEKEEESNDSNTPVPDEEKTLKKPDKILPCPRCKSMDTKFCYYNNYNVNQPRYFCKNCQRYWTSGGTMRNVPVGSGRRKTKHAALPNPHHIIVSDGTLPSGGFLFGPESSFPVSFYPTATYWTMPVSSLGKHSREEENMVVTSKENLDAERSVWIPKTLRIHDPSEAAKSSLWSTLGRIKNEKPGPVYATGLFKAFDPKGDRINHVDSREMVRQANPAALSRSLNFHESA